MKKTGVVILLTLAGITDFSAFAIERVNPFKEDFLIPEAGVIECETVDALTKAYPKWNKTKIWHPKAGEGPIIANPAQVISYCDKWSRHDLGGHSASKGLCSWRNARGVAHNSKMDPNGLKQFADYDVDGSGTVDAGEYVRSYPWSLTNPMGVPQWPFSGTFPDRTSATLYGGATAYVTHGIKDGGTGGNGRGGGFAELGINCDHNNTWWDPRAEDHPLNFCPNAKNSKSWVQAYYVLCWKKEDFLNVNEMKYKVTFDADSVIGSQPARVYWVGWDDTRFIVQDGAQWYISDGKQAKAYMPEGTGYGRRKDGSHLSGFVCRINPNQAIWAKYDPENYKIHLDHETAKYEKHEFKDIQAIGWYIAKDRKTPGEQAHCKWYGLSAKAVINRPEQGSVNIDMVELNGSSSPFYISTCEVPYMLYKKIHKWGDVPFHQLDARYVYRTHADMGSMTYLPEGRTQKHGQDEPATNLEWYDALLWCNTLSEHEGKEPVYYLDAEFKIIFRGDHLTTKALNPGYDKLQNTNPTWEKTIAPKVYVKWAADGHRLPTVSEWETARGTKSEPGDLKTEGTVAVGSGEANENGLYDMDGNAWELVWTHGDVYDPAHSAVTALGGGFTDKPLSKYGDTPWNGNGDIGIRIVRRKSGLSAPADANSASPVNSRIPAWTFKRGERTKAIATADKQQEQVLDLLKLPGGLTRRGKDGKKINIHPFYAAKYETSYAKWQEVLEWAEAHGYEFSKNGDMGSMYYFGYPHESTEPVVEITWIDAIIWCNALSEMEGRTPVFYTDEAKTAVKRKAEVYRPVKMDTRDMFDPDKEPPLEKYMGESVDHPFIWYFVKWAADGYRLPTQSEFEYMLRGGKDEVISTGADYNWSGLNSEGRTHPVGTKKPNELGLYDVLGNATEWSISSNVRTTYRKVRPYGLALNNPKDTLTLAYGVKGIQRDPAYAALGGSWLNEGSNVEALLYGSVTRNRYDYFPDFGFRVIRCDAGTHPEDGKEKLKSALQMKINPEHFNDFNNPGAN